MIIRGRFNREDDRDRECGDTSRKKNIHKNPYEPEEIKKNEEITTKRKDGGGGKLRTGS